MQKEKELESLLLQYKALGIDSQIDYEKFYLYSIITHSTAIEGSTITEIENQLLFDQGISIGGRTLTELYMNLDLKAAYDKCRIYVGKHSPITIQLLKELSSIAMKNTGKVYNTAIGGKSYMSFNKVPSRLKEFCEELNLNRKDIGRKTRIEQYLLSFDAHYDLATIHPWADGNGRMARLLMNMIQFEFGLIPAKILKEDKEHYIKALVETREADDKTIFRNYMLDVMIKNIKADIMAYVQSTGESVIAINDKEKSREKIIRLLGENGNMTTATLAQAVGISTKAIEKHLSKLKSEGIISRIGPDKGGHWEVSKSSEEKIGTATPL